MVKIKTQNFRYMWDVSDNVAFLFDTHLTRVIPHLSPYQMMNTKIYYAILFNSKHLKY